MILKEYSLGMAAEWNLMDLMKDFKVDKKLKLYYLVDDKRDERSIFFSDAHLDGVKYTACIGSDYYELTVHKVNHSKIRRHNKIYLTIVWVLTHIAVDQTINTRHLFTESATELARYTPKAVMSFVCEVFNQNASEIMRLLLSGKDMSELAFCGLPKLKYIQEGGYEQRILWNWCS